MFGELGLPEAASAGGAGPGGSESEQGLPFLDLGADGGAPLVVTDVSLGVHFSCAVIRAPKRRMLGRQPFGSARLSAVSLLRRLSAWFVRLWRRLRGGGSPLELGVSVAIGLFVGCLPLYGLHFSARSAGVLALRARRGGRLPRGPDWNPWFAPFLVALEARIGGLVLGRRAPRLEELGLGQLGELFETTLVGGLLLGVALALVGGTVTWFVAARSRRTVSRPFEHTIGRYSGQSRADRWYVDLKLRTNPVVEQLSELGPLGRTIDAGGGRGGIGLWLLDQEKLTRLEGFDPDTRKVDAPLGGGGGCNLHGRGLATLPARARPGRHGALDRRAALSRARRAASSPRPREVLACAPRSSDRAARWNIRPGLKSAFTRGLERLATAVGYNRAARPLGFRPLRELISELESLGFRCELVGDSAGTPFDNALILAALEGDRATASA